LGDFLRKVGCTDQHNVKIERLQRWDFYNASLHQLCAVSWRCKNLQHQRCNYSTKKLQDWFYNARSGIVKIYNAGVVNHDCRIGSSAVKIYKATSSLVRFENKNIFFDFVRTL
jgi:hypothetical protein